MKKGKQTSRHLVSSAEPFLRRSHLQAFPVVPPFGADEASRSAGRSSNDRPAMGLAGIAEAATSSLCIAMHVPQIVWPETMMVRRSSTRDGDLRLHERNRAGGCSVLHRCEDPGGLRRCVQSFTSPRCSRPERCRASLPRRDEDFRSPRPERRYAGQVIGCEGCRAGRVAHGDPVEWRTSVGEAL